MFIVGNAVRPAFLGPLADIDGRKWVYVISIFLYAVLNIGTALAYNLPMLITFQFLCGTAGSTALSNVAERLQICGWIETMPVNQWRCSC
jgi:MFS family permease